MAHSSPKRRAAKTRPKGRRSTAKGVGEGGVVTKGDIHLSPATKRLSTQHHRENLAFNLRHAKEHLVQAKVAAKKITAAGQRVPGGARRFRVI
jgi:hypothetical protein